MSFLYRVYWLVLKKYGKLTPISKNLKQQLVFEPIWS